MFVCGGVFVLGSSVSGAPSGELKFNFFLYFQLGPAGVVVVVIVAGCSSDGVLFLKVDYFINLRKFVENFKFVCFTQKLLNFDLKIKLRI